MQLAFSLQKRGIEAHQPPITPDATPDVMFDAYGNDGVASYKTASHGAPRQLLFCRLMRDGLETIRCSNCQASKPFRSETLKPETEI